MYVLQTNSGTFNGSGFTVTLLNPTSPSNVVVVLVAGNTVVSTPSGWQLRTSKVQSGGHYWFETAGGSTSWAFANSAGQGTWVALELESASFDVADGAQSSPSSSTTYTSPTLVPSAGLRVLLCSFLTLQAGTGLPIVTTSVTGGFTKIADLQVVVNDAPNGALAVIDAVTADGVTGYSSTATWNQDTNVRGALIGAYRISGVGGIFRAGVAVQVG